MLTSSVVEAAQGLKQGHVLAYPTEAVWGLGCDPFNEQAFHKVLSLKQRPIEKGVILLAGNIDQVQPLLEHVTLARQKQIIQSWSPRNVPERATTWLLPVHAAQIPDWITGQHRHVAVRVTTHALCIALCNAFNGFIVSTSANFAGLEPARSLQQARQYFASDVDYLEGDLGLSQQPSRVIDALTGQMVRA